MVVPDLSSEYHRLDKLFRLVSYSLPSNELELQARQKAVNI